MERGTDRDRPVEVVALEHGVRDPHGVAVLCRVLTAFGAFLVVFGAYRGLVGDAYWWAIVLAGGLFVVVGLRLSDWLDRLVSR